MFIPFNHNIHPCHDRNDVKFVHHHHKCKEQTQPITPIQQVPKCPDLTLGPIQIWWMTLGIWALPFSTSSNQRPKPCSNVLIRSLYMYICIYVYMYIYMFTCVYIYICACLYICAYICKYIYMYICKYI